MVRVRIRSLLTLGLIAVFALVAVDASGLPSQARLFPYVVAFVALPLLVWQLVVELSPALSRREPRDAGTDFAATDAEKRGAGLARAGEFFLWLFAFVAALWALGFRVAIPAFLLLFLLRGGERWWMAAAFAAGGWAATHFIFGKALVLPLPKGALWQALGLL